MPAIDRNTFVNRLQGKSFKEADLKAAYPGVDVRGLAQNGVIHGTPENLDKLWKAIDKFDSDGNAQTVSGRLPVQIAEWVLAKAGASTTINPPSGGGPIPGLGNLPDNSQWKKVAEAGDKAITAKTKAHHDAIDQTGIGRYYGDHGSFHGSVKSGDRDGIKAEIEGATNGQWTLAGIGRGAVDVKGPNGATATLKESSCIGWVMENVKAAYEGAGKASRFAQIEQRMRDADMRGTVLCEELQKDGWSAVFYSPRTAQDLRDSGENEKLGALNMAKNGSRVWRAVTVEGSKGVKVDAVVSGYREVSPDAKTDAQLKKLEQAPFMVGVANGGMHTFVAHNGNVCDFHWTAGPTDKGAMTENPVRQWEWDTGLYMVPPGYWKNPTSSTGDV